MAHDKLKLLILTRKYSYLLTFVDLLDVQVFKIRTREGGNKKGKGFALARSNFILFYFIFFKKEKRKERKR